MNTAVSVESLGPVRDLVAAWGEAISGVSGQLAGAPFQVSASLAEVGSLPALPPEMIWVRFAAAKALSGMQVLGIPAADSPRLAGLLLGETPPAAAEPTSEHRDAVAELFRQFAGSAALLLKSKAGGEVDLSFQGHRAPDFPSGASATIRVQSPAFASLEIVLCMSPELLSSLTPAPSPEPPAAEPMSAAALPAQAPFREPNLDLLLDVELETSLRFGERSMLLRDVLELGPGAVIELDRQVDEPVELLVGSKVIARGEVVVVDGNYGLRVKEMASRQERIDSIRT